MYHGTMILRGWAKHATAVSGYVLLALFFCRPIAERFTTHIVGPAGGESAVGLWSVWYFRYAVTVLGSNPMWTDHQYWPYGANLVLHNYSPFAGLLGMLLQVFFNLEATYNILLVSSLVLAGYGVFLLLTDWDTDWRAAFVAGMVFAFSSVMNNEMALGGGLDRMGIHTIPFFVWTFSRAVRGGGLVDAALAALCLTWVWGYQYKYFLMCTMLIPVFFVCFNRPVRMTLSSRPSTPGLRAAARGLEVAFGLALLLCLRSIWSGQRQFHGSGDFRTLATYVMPYLAFWGFLGLRLAVKYSPGVALDRESFGWDRLAPYLSTSGFWALLNLPMIVSVVFFMLTGDYGGPSKSWRGGGGAVNPIPMFFPSVTHPLWGPWIEKLTHIDFLSFGDSLSLGLVPLAGVLWLWRSRPADRWISLWFWCLAFSFIMTLGPWLKVFSVQTYLPLPFYFIHLLPIFSNLQNGNMLNVFITLFEAILFGACLNEIMSRSSRRISVGVVVLAFCMLAVELFPAKRETYALRYSPLLHRLAERPDGAMLTIPTAAVFDALDPMGNRGGVPDIREQIVHHKPRVGGFLGRVSSRTYRAMISDPYWMAIVAAQSGGEIPSILYDGEGIARYLRRGRIRYVLVDGARAPEALQRAVSRWRLRLVDSEGPLRLYLVMA